MIAHADALTQTLYHTEGRCESKHGKSGEYGCFQYQQRTWNTYSTIVAGKVLPQTEQNEWLITKAMVLKWKQEGVSDRGIFLTWNQGSPTGWGGGTDCYAGTNKMGIHYDSCDYAARATAYLKTL